MKNCYRFGNASSVCEKGPLEIHISEFVAQWLRWIVFIINLDWFLCHMCVMFHIHSFPDNVFAIKSWAKKKFGFENTRLDKAFGIPEDFDYINWPKMSRSSDCLICSTLHNQALFAYITLFYILFSVLHVRDKAVSYIHCKECGVNSQECPTLEIWTLSSLRQTSRLICQHEWINDDKNAPGV